MRDFVRTTLMVLAALAVGGFLFAWSGLYNVGASKGHWPFVTWFLHFAMRSSVETHAIGVTVPALDDPAMVYEGLGHYQGGCAPCHGRPGERQGTIARHQLPEPPYLPDVVAEWKPEELFWIVKNGLKYTGMPAWPAQTRDDEAWAVVAGLLRLPEMGEAEYRRITEGETLLAPDRLAETARVISAAGPVGEDLVACGRCHGLHGAGGGAGAFPRLAGLGEAYLYEALKAYAQGTRASGIMQPIAAELSEENMRLLAAHYAQAQVPYPEPAPVPEAVLARGRAIAENGIPERDVAACLHCHGPERLPLYPSLDGQFPSYLAEQLRLWSKDRPSARPTAQVMDMAVHELNEDEIRAVSQYFAARRPGGQ